MTTHKPTELAGATRQAVAVHGAEIRAQVHLDSVVRKKVGATLNAASAAAPPDRVFLNLENVRGKADSPAFHVFVGTPGTAGHDAGSIALFGVRKASLPDGEHGGGGVTFVIDITRIVDKLHLAHAFDVESLDVRLVPVRPIPESAGISIARGQSPRGCRGVPRSLRSLGMTAKRRSPLASSRRRCTSFAAYSHSPPASSTHGPACASGSGASATMYPASTRYWGGTDRGPHG